VRFTRSVLTISKVLLLLKEGNIDLQPNFQRGEVWSERKKQGLIDSILRAWYVPPIHLVRVPSRNDKEVLDGQQRLLAIQQFSKNAFAIDASIPPESGEILELHDLRYSELPTPKRREFNRFKLTIFTLDDFEPAEPGELFFRLNQPATLTTAEQRNAFYGPARDQVKEWVRMLKDGGVDESVIGFSNRRMAYDDTIARVALSVEHGSLAKKVTAEDLVDKYRSASGYASGTVHKVTRALNTFCKAGEYFTAGVRFNKATLYSWLIFLIRAETELGKAGSRKLSELFATYAQEFWANLQSVQSTRSPQHSLWQAGEVDRQLLTIYEDRATSRVADVSSVILRDLVIWICLPQFLKRTHSESFGEMRMTLRSIADRAQAIHKTAAADKVAEEALERVALRREWGVFV
jgi:hypothetical protein